MIKGFYSAVSAMMAGVERQNVLAHNAANINTPGFKEVLSSLTDFTDTPVEFPPDGDVNNQVNYVGRLGLGVETTPITTNFLDGTLQLTGNEFDMALTGNAFFRIRTPAGERLTRDGRFLKDAQGSLVTQEGYAVLNAAGQPVKLAEGSFKVNPDGSYSVNQVAAGQLGIMAFANPETDVVRDENNTFVAVGKAVTQTGTYRVDQGYLETSNVNASQLMTQMVTVARSYEAAQKMVTTQDELLGRAISTLGRVA